MRTWGGRTVGGGATTVTIGGPDNKGGEGEAREPGGAGRGF